MQFPCHGERRKRRRIPSAVVGEGFARFPRGLSTSARPCNDKTIIEMTITCESFCSFRMAAPRSKPTWPRRHYRPRPTVANAQGCGGCKPPGRGNVGTRVGGNPRTPDRDREEHRGGGRRRLAVHDSRTSAVHGKKTQSASDRREAYEEVAPAIAGSREELGALDEAAARQRCTARARVLYIAELDFFPAAPHARLREGLNKLRSSIDRRFSPEEPSAAAGGIPRCDAQEYRGARWATRKRLWVDRIASAWLIRRFIDRAAKFEWLDEPAELPDDAHGFDFDGATFTHVGSLVTFEVLLAAFDIGDDPGLSGLARLVHYLDVGGELVAEAAGFEAVLAGLRESCADDNALLQATTPILDALYRHFSVGS